VVNLLITHPIHSERILRPTCSHSAAAVSAATADSNAPTPGGTPLLTNKNEKKNNHHDQADGVENSLIAAQIVPHVQVPVGSQVVEKPAEKVAAVATSLMTVAAVSLSSVPIKDAKSGGGEGVGGVC